MNDDESYVLPRKIKGGPVIALQEPFIINSQSDIVVPHGYLNPETNQIVAEAGDLAVGIEDEDAHERLGWYFLSGQAASLIAFARDLQPDLTECKASAAFLDIPEDVSNIKTWRTSVTKLAKKAKYGRMGVNAFVFRVDTDDMKVAKPLFGEVVTSWACPPPMDWDIINDAREIPHLFGVILGPEEATISVHVQPYIEAHERSADALGILLLSDAVLSQEEGED